MVVPEISVIIPTYQHGQSLARTLDFIFAQSVKDLEVIVINDGSTDNTDEAVKPYLGRIIYKKIANAGAPAARNAGFALSHGAFVIFCDADVIDMDRDLLKKMHQALIANPDAAYAYCGFRFGRAHFKPQPFDPKKLREINYIHTTSLIRRADFLGFDEKIKKFQDWDLWLSLLSQGKVGVAVNETLISFEPRRGGISQWLPKILYSRFFESLGLRLKPVVRYRHFSEVIAKKHGLDQANKASTNRLWAWFLVIFLLSAVSFGHPWLGTIISVIILLGLAAATLNRLLYGVLVMLAELILGSLAGKTLALTLPGFVLPLRFSIFAIVGAIWLIRLLQGRVRWPQKHILLGVAFVLIAVGWGIANGLRHGLPFHDVFFDANAYFALPMILFFASAIETERDQQLLKKVLKHGAIALSIVTLAALYFFSHKFWNPAGVFAYKWLRDSRIAEITALNGGIYRIFIQSQIYCLLAFLWLTIKDTARGWKNMGWAVLPATALLISGSRSFALGLTVALAVWLVMALQSRSGAEIGPTLKKIICLAIGGAIIYAGLLFIPLPAMRSQTSFQDMLRSRSVSDRDAATASRWSLLPKLNEKIKAAPILGNGFGTSVTYQSSDPRIISSTDGAYTTSAFEWNYQDILVKMGLLGLLAYGYLLYAILTVLLKAEAKERLWLVPSFFALLALNALSPFLNHPLGIGYLALLLALAERQRGEIAPVTVAEIIKSPSRAVVAAPGLAMISEE